MKLPSLISATTIIFLASCSSAHKAETSDTGAAAVQSHPIVIDGRDDDWPKQLPYTISSEKISYAISNDGDNLYILLSTRNPQTQQKIIQGGMTVWVNTKGDKSESEAVGIGYPLDTRNDHDRQLMEEAQPQRYQHDKPVTLEDKKDYALYGFVRDSIPSYSYGDDGNPQGVKMRMDYSNDGNLLYEASIPLATLYPHHNPSSSYAANSVAVGIFIEGLPPDARVPRGGGGGGGPAIGIGGGVGFGSFGSGGGLGISIGTGSLIGNGGRRQAYKSTQTWQVVQLARTGAPGPKPF